LVTQSLIEARVRGPFEFSKLAHALDWNRRVWSTFASDCSTETNTMTPALRAGIISLSIFVTKHSSAVLREGADIEPLIDINRTVMQGLEHSLAARPATAA
jgi:flagellar protein FlaF